jgi:L-aminopeptidase/D-esterase-like protein
MRNRSRLSFLAVFLLLVPFVSFAQREAPRKPRARDLGVPFDGTPGRFNAITDVSGVLSATLLWFREGKLQIGKAWFEPASQPSSWGKESMNDAVFAGWFSQNGNGETGTTWVEESGFSKVPS